MYTKICKINTLTENKPFHIWIDKNEIIVLKKDEKIVVFSGMCPHQGGPLIKGEISFPYVVCPWHGCKFDLRNGECKDFGSCSGNIKGIKIKLFDHLEKDGDIFLEL